VLAKAKSSASVLQSSV